MSDKIRTFIKRNMMLTWLIIALFTIASIVAFAEFTRVKKVKRVVSVQSDEGVMFSSNYMSTIIPAQVRNVPKTTDDSNSVEIVVRNYPQGNVSRVYPASISYKLKATLCDANGDPLIVSQANSAAFNTANYSICTVTVNNNGTRTNGNSVNFASTTVQVGNETKQYYIATIDTNSLEGGVTDENYFLLTFDGGQKALFASTVYVKLETEIENAGDDISDLAGYVGIYKKMDSGWSMTLSDDVSKNVEDYHGFNYTLAGSGSTTVRISWNPNQLRISELFLKENSLTVENDAGNVGMKCVTFTVNSENVSRYDIQFYKVSTFNLSSMNDLAVGNANIKLNPDYKVG